MLWKRIPLTPVHYSTILGVAWNPISDEQVFDIRGMVSDLQTLEPTKRSIVGFSYNLSCSTMCESCVSRSVSSKSKRKLLYGASATTELLVLKSILWASVDGTTLSAVP